MPVALVIEVDEPAFDPEGAHERAVAVLGGGTELIVEDGTVRVTFLFDRPSRRAAALRALARHAVGEIVSEAPGRASRAGVGCGESPDAARLAGAPDWDRPAAVARAKAKIALELGKAVWREPRVVLYDDVRIFEALRRDPLTVRSLASLIEPLVAHDERYGADLVATVEAFSEADLSQVTTAARIGAHRHTVHTRLLLAEKILGRSVRSGPDRMLVELALKARRLLFAPPAAKR